jgi:lysyl-tRNA synthetase, class II
MVSLVRLAKAERLREPYPAGYPRTRLIGEIRAEFPDLAPDQATGVIAGVAGRVMLRRDGGGLCFATIRDGSGEIQVMLSRASTGEQRLAEWKQTVDLGDHVGVTGEVISSRRGELSVLASSFAVTAKALRAPPGKHSGLTDPAARVRRRYLDLLTRPDARRAVTDRAAVLRSVREQLHGRGFLEVETPVLQTRHGGAAARPFRTRSNAYSMDLFLRIALELHLKRLVVGGLEQVYEIGRVFRNEGADASHSPEFTMLELYQAYADYDTMASLTRELIQAAAIALHGRPVARRPDGSVADIGGEWRSVTVHEAVSAALGEPVPPQTSGEEVLELYERLVEPRTVAPAFYRDFPVDVSPLTRRHRRDPRLAERWDLVAFGSEIATAYTELTDPVEQRARLAAQGALDEDFVEALEYGMPPTGGMGMGIDRLLIMLTGRPIRETIAFPLVKPR